MPSFPSSSASPLLCAGEVLWDALPAGLFLGGALYNVAAHLHALGQPSALVSRVGDDVLGDEVRRRMQAQGMRTALVQTDPEHPTGFVRVSLDAEGTADYTILEPVAWDEIAWTDALAERARTAQAVVIGSLAQRRDPSRTTLQRLCDTVDGPVAYDVNLRPPHTGRSIVEASLERANIVKLNDEELRQMHDWFDVSPTDADGAAALASRFDLRTCCVTRGGEGALLWHEGKLHSHPGYDVTVEDTVGAGDAFWAALLSELLSDAAEADVLDRACRLGGFVASQSGAVPDYDADALEAVGPQSSSS